MASIAVPLLVLATTHSPTAAGIALFVGRLPVLWYLPAGVMADRWNRKQTMLWCEVIRLVAFAGLTLSIFLGQASLALLLLVSFINGALAVVFEVAEKSALPSYVPPELLPNAISRNQARAMAADIAGPPSGGALFAVAPALPFLANTISYIVSSITLILVRGESRPGRKLKPDQEQGGQPSRRPAWMQEVIAGFQWLWHDGFLRTAAIVAAFVNFVFSGLILVLIVAADERGGTALGAGFVIGCFGAGGIIGAMIAPKVLDLTRRSVVFIGTIWLWVLLIPALLITPSTWWMGAVAALISLAAPVWNVAAQLYQYERIPQEIYGCVSSSGMMLSSAAAPLGALAAGTLLGSAGITAAVLSCTGIMLISALAALMSKGLRTAEDSSAQRVNQDQGDRM
jgi:MFS family permease